MMEAVAFETVAGVTAFHAGKMLSFAIGGSGSTKELESELLVVGLDGEDRHKRKEDEEFNHERLENK